MTLPLINHARRITCLVTGDSKSRVIQEILTGAAAAEKYPAAQVKPVQGKLEWLLDEPAASRL